MEIELRLDPSLEAVRVVVHAPARTAEAEALLVRLASLTEDEGTIFGFQGERVVPLQAAKILRFYGEDKEVRAQTAGEIYTVRLRLYELEERLDKRTFLRTSHSEIVNWKRVTALDLGLTGTIRVTLEGGVTTYVSRRYVKKIKEVLGL